MTNQEYPRQLARDLAASSRALYRLRTASPVWLAVATLLSACGAGTAAAVAGGGGSSGGNAPPSMSGFTVLNPKEPAEARVRFVLSDAEANTAKVELFYQSPGESAERITQAGANPAMLATSRDGIEYTLPWNFAAEPELPDDARFIDGVHVFARVEGGTQEIVLGANGASLGLGNDAPDIRDITVPTAEVNGTVGIAFTVADSSDDVVDVRVEFDLVGDDPDAGWRLARPGLDPSTPALAFEGVVADRDGTHLEFFWDTDVDLAEIEHDVRLRFTAIDPAVQGAAKESAPFRVDNNEEPIATVHGDLLLINPDQRAGIPIPYTVRDEESDEVQVVFQWRRPDQDFPSLPNTPVEINAILADPVLRRERHICTEYPTYVEGRVVPIDSTHVRLPELATTASSILAHGIVGRELEIMRASKVSKPIAATWATNSLNHPVAALPVGDGIEALVLDRASLGAWRLRQIDLATGIVTRELVSSATGEPNAMAFERDDQSVLIASDVGGAWQLSRVTIANGALTPLITFDGTTESGAVRGLASEGSNAALVTVASSLIRLDYSDATNPRSATLFDDLSTPWGVVLDPSKSNRIYVAEYNAPSNSEPGRITVIDLDRRARSALTFGAGDPSEAVVPAPQSLAFDRRSDRLLIVQAPPFDNPIVLGIDVGISGATASFPLSHSFLGLVGTIATGPNGLIVIALTSQNDLAVANGLEQRRSIDGFELAHRVMHVTAAFSPTLSVSQPFRVRKPSPMGRPSPTGARGSFLWDSEDAVGGGPMLFRAVPMDAERGVEGTTEAAKPIRSPLDTEPLALGNASVTNGPFSVTAADLDGDGDLDLASANRDRSTLTVFFQESPGVFGATPLSLGNASVTNGPYSVAAADLDGDGDLDLVSANQQGNTLTVFFQESPGVFGATPLSLGNASVTNGPWSVTAADLDGDGDLDLASANRYGSTLTVFFQTSPGAFGAIPLTLGNANVTSLPVVVTAADLDGDGDLDLASANLSTLTVFFQGSPGVFETTPLSLGNASVTNGPASVTAADLDGDGDLDLASTNLNTLTVFFQESPGVFGATPLSLGNASVTNGPYSVTAADVDGDGDLDLTSANIYSNTLTVFFQESPGVFGATPLSLGNASATNGPASVTAADLDGDGDLDLASANYYGDTLTVFLQRSPGVFGSTPLSLGNVSVTANPYSAAAADIDGDGDLDLVSANLDSDTLTVFFQVSPGVFGTTPLSLGNASVTNGPLSVTAADIDGDGDLDLTSANVYSKTLTVFFQASPGVFGTTPLSLGNASVTNSPLSVTAADLDGDGDLDLASANEQGNTLTVFFQTSPGVFGSTPLSLGNESVTYSPRSVAAADLDGDGDLDLVSANAISNSLTIFFQERPGVFSETPLALGNESVTNLPVLVTAADVDGDGDLDLASANGGSNTLTVFFQQSPGVFGTTPLSLGNESMTYSPRSVAAADIDGDGDIDLASANGGSNTLTVFFQESPGVFGATPLSLGNASVTNGPWSVTAADLDGDGDLDLASANGLGNTLTIFWNNH